MKLLSLDDACLGDCIGLETDNVDTETADQEMFVIQLHATSTSKHQQPEGLTFLCWLHLLVSDLTVLENLSLFFSHGAPSRMKVHIHAIALPPTSTDKALWQPVIKRALHTQAPLLYRHYDEIITTLIDHIKTGQEHMHAFTFYHHFTEQGMAVPGSVHCEAALACLVKYQSTALPVHGMEVQRDVWFFLPPIYSVLTRLYRQPALVGLEILPSQGFVVLCVGICWHSWIPQLEGLEFKAIISR
jgi:hypothetical protein